MVPTGDEWVSQAARRAGLDRCADRQIHTQKVCVCVRASMRVCVCVCEQHREQQCQILSYMCFLCQGAGAQKEVACWDARQG